MGRVVVPAKIESLEDLFEVEKGRLPQEQVRTVEVQDALVDTGATILSLPRRYIQQLGLRRSRSRRSKTAAGVIEIGVYQPVRLTVQGRECTTEVAELPDDCPALIGQIPLEVLDFVVDPVGQQLIGNPAHGGEQMLEMY
jgi:predicted aspartyl protease